jgi:DNA helicase-2/ATP-dependent DNA helicase PcrA
MPIELSFAQKRIVVCKSPQIIVKACPGSGKTLSVAARLARLLQSNNLGRHQGIAVLSFTNTACEEIKKKLKGEFGRTEEIGHPHFIGTIDSFINNYVFLPYGHLEMGCTVRPEIVGTEFNKWHNYDSSKKNYDRTKIVDPNYFFDKVSFDIKNNLLRLAPYQTFNFGKEYWVDQRKVNQEYKKYILDLMNMKRAIYKDGKANQADANYISYRTIKEKTSIGANLVERFPIIIIDEAQDSTDIQMSIIDLLIKSGLKNIMLIGDPDQAIFEWNTANPELFKKKWDNKKDWHQLELKENYRSSSNICELLNSFYGNTIISNADDKDCLETPDIIAHNDSVARIRDIQKQFYEKCSELGIPNDEIAIVYRGKSFGEEYFDIEEENGSNKELPWVNKNYYVRDIAHGKYLTEIGNFKAGIKLLEKGYLKRLLDKTTISSKEIQDYKDEKGYRVFRNELFDFIEKLGTIKDSSLKIWQEATKNNGVLLPIVASRSDVKVEKLFYYDDSINKDKYINTIHSVKGMSLDAILVFLKKKAVSTNYTTILKSDNEEKRVVYVAFSRPRKLLWIVVPNDDIDCWRNFLYPTEEIEKQPVQQVLDFGV